MNQDEIRLLEFLDFACVHLGFCLPQEERNSIAAGGPYDPSELARIILTKEGLDPENELRLFRDLRNAYAAFLAES